MFADVYAVVQKNMWLRQLCGAAQWASQGVFMLNAVLTVRAHAAASHAKQGCATSVFSVLLRNPFARCSMHLRTELQCLWASQNKGGFSTELVTIETRS